MNGGRVPKRKSPARAGPSRVVWTNARSAYPTAAAVRKAARGGVMPARSAAASVKSSGLPRWRWEFQLRRHCYAPMREGCRRLLRLRAQKLEQGGNAGDGGRRPHARPGDCQEEISADHNDMIYAESCAQIEARRKAFLRKWRRLAIEPHLHGGAVAFSRLVAFSHSNRKAGGIRVRPLSGSRFGRGPSSG